MEQRTLGVAIHGAGWVARAHAAGWKKNPCRSDRFRDRRGSELRGELRR